MSRLWGRFKGLFSSRSLVGMDKSGNRYFARNEEIDGIRKKIATIVKQGLDNLLWRFEATELLIVDAYMCNLNSVKEKKWVVFKGEQDPTSIPVEWICWLNGQRKRSPTPEEMAELEARRERVKLNVALLKKEEEERKAKEGITHKAMSKGKVAGPDLKSFIQQFPVASEGDEVDEASDAMGGGMRGAKGTQTDKKVPRQAKQQPESSEPTGSGESFRPGTWQPPS